MQTVEAWLNSREIRKIRNKPVTELVTREFFRDPMRPLYYNPNVFYAPADGIVLYAYRRLKSTEKLVEVKGKEFTVPDLLYDKNYVEDSLVIGIFMTVLDVHVNRVPTDSYMSDTVETPYLFTNNTSMYFFEQELFDKLKINRDKLEYLFMNEKLVSTLYSQRLKDDYYLIQIADKDVNCILNWGEGDFLQQGERFGMIRWGSQVDIVIPLTKELEEKFDFEILVEPMMHVKAGVDKIIKLKEKIK